MVTLAPDIERVEEDTSELRASAIGTHDEFCHVMAGQAPFTETECGLTLRVALPLMDTHPGLPCPNGNPICPDCA